MLSRLFLFLAGFGHRLWRLFFMKNYWFWSSLRWPEARHRPHLRTYGCNNWGPWPRYRMFFLFARWFSVPCSSTETDRISKDEMLVYTLAYEKGWASRQGWQRRYRLRRPVVREKVDALFERLFPGEVIRDEKQIVISGNVGILTAARLVLLSEWSSAWWAQLASARL